MSSLHRIVVVACLLVGFAPAAAWADMMIAGLTPGDDSDRYERFNNSPDFIGAAFDFAPVGHVAAPGATRNGAGWATMVSPSYFLSAAHAPPGSDLTFYEGNDLAGPSHTYSIASGTAIAGTDLYLGRLTTTVDPAIGFVPVLQLPTLTDYVDVLLYNYGVPDLVGRNVVDAVGTATLGPSTGDVIQFDFDPSGVPYGQGLDETFLQPGDSGAGSFAVVNGQLALLGIHWGIDNNIPASYDTIVGQYVTDINAAMTGESLTITFGPAVTVPEPTSIGLLALCGVVLIAARFRSLRASTVNDSALST